MLGKDFQCHKISQIQSTDYLCGLLAHYQIEHPLAPQLSSCGHIENHLKQGRYYTVIHLV